MTRRMLRSSVCLLALAAAACGPTPTAGPTVSSVAVTLKDATVAAGFSTEVSAVATLSDGKTKDVTTLARWSTSDQAKALVACTKSPCPVTTISAGTVTFTATYAGKSATANLTVTTASLKTVTVNASRTSIAKGATTVLSAVGQFTDGTAKDISADVTWTSSDASILTIAGALATGAGTGSATVTAALNGVSGTLSITVTAAEPQTLTLSPAPLTVPVGSTQQMVALLTYSDGSSADVASTATWTSSDTAVAVVSTTGVVHGLAQGTSTISATSNGLTAGETVNVGAPTVISISITPSPLALLVGGSQQLTATALLSDGSTTNVTSTATWGSSDATVVTVNTAGLLSAVAAGTAEVGATVGDVTGTAPVSVTQTVITSIDVTPATSSLALGLQLQMHATAHMNDNTSMDVTGAVVWSSASPAEVLISASGMVTASAQTTSPVTVTATVGDASGTATVSVTDPVLASLSIAPSAPTVVAGFTVALTLTGTLTDDTTEDDTAVATWTSSNTDIATVDASGVVTGIINGSVTITASYGGFSKSVTVTVSPPVISSITVSPNTVSVPLGHSQQLVVDAVLSNGAHATVTTQTTWSSDDPTGLIATISATGLVHTVAVSGTPVTFTATAGGKTATAVVTVADPVVDSIALTPTAPDVFVGYTVNFSAQGTWSDGTTTDITATATWSSSTPLVATVSAGVVTTLSAGTSTITATVGTVSKSVPLTVRAVVLETIVALPSTVSVVAGRTQALTVTGYLSNGTYEDETASVTWTSDDAAGTFATIAADGTVTAVSATTTPVTFTAHLNGLTTTSVVTVTPAEPENITIKPAPLSVAHGASFQLLLEASMSDGSIKDLASSATWETSDATIVSISASGVVHGEIESATGATITATLGELTATGTVTVGPAQLSSLAVDPSPVSVAVGLTQLLSVSGTFTDGHSEDFTTTAGWTSNDEAVVTVSDAGLVTAIAEGATTLHVAYGLVSVDVPVTVTPAVVTSLTLTAPQTQIPVGVTAVLTATGHYSDGSVHAITSPATWSVDEPDFATVRSDGAVTAVAPGPVTVTVTADSVQQTLDLTMVAPIDSITVDPSTLSLAAGLSSQVHVIATLTDTTTVDVTSLVAWSSTDLTGTTASISPPGLITSVAESATDVTFTATISTSTADVVVTVLAAQVTSITVTQPFETVEVGASEQLSADGLLTDQTHADVTAQVTWSSADDGLATVDTTGVVTCVDTQPVTITASMLVGGSTISGGITVVCSPL